VAEFLMPSLGADMDQGTLLEWLVKPGDQIHKGDIIAVVDTDKSAIEVESFHTGTVERLVRELGETVPVGTVLAVIAEPAVEGVAAKPAAVNGMVGARPAVVITLSADHRASDGYTGARFLTAMSDLLQRPEEL
jgi:pyruvate dehydrogenase E2 component (dihydrolipoamide acetyltransferase)